MSVCRVVPASVIRSGIGRWWVLPVSDYRKRRSASYIEREVRSVTERERERNTERERERERETQKCRKTDPRSVEYNFFISCDRQILFLQNERRRADLQNDASDFLLFAKGLSYDLSKFSDDFIYRFIAKTEVVIGRSQPEPRSGEGCDQADHGRPVEAMKVFLATVSQTN